MNQLVFTLEESQQLLLAAQEHKNLLEKSLLDMSRNDDGYKHYKQCYLDARHAYMKLLHVFCIGDTSALIPNVSAHKE